MFLKTKIDGGKKQNRSVTLKPSIKWRRNRTWYLGKHELFRMLAERGYSLERVRYMVGICNSSLKNTLLMPYRYLTLEQYHIVSIMLGNTMEECINLCLMDFKDI